MSKINPCFFWAPAEGVEPTEALTEMLGRLRGARYLNADGSIRIYLFVDRPVAGVSIDLTELTIEELQIRFDNPVKTNDTFLVTVAQAHAIRAANEIKTPELI